MENLAGIMVYVCSLITQEPEAGGPSWERKSSQANVKLRSQLTRTLTPDSPTVYFSVSAHVGILGGVFKTTAFRPDLTPIKQDYLFH